MAKSKAKKSSGTKRVLPKIKRGVTPNFGQAAAAYARLLADPCNGDLVPGPFGDGTGGMVARFEQEYLIQAGVGSTALAWLFSPARANWAATTTGTIGDSTVITMTNNTAPSQSPGFNFFASNASQIRPLSCCAQVYWTGSELNRQGIVSLGRVPAEVVNDSNVTVSQLRSMSQYVERTPAGMSEIVWRPTEWDQMFTEPAATTPNTLAESRATALLITGSGLPADQPLRIRVVVVYEWVPDPLSGFRTTTSKIAEQPVRLADVLARLDAAGDWMTGHARMAGRAISSVTAGVGSILSLGNGAARLGARLLGV